MSGQTAPLVYACLHPNGCNKDACIKTKSHVLVPRGKAYNCCIPKGCKWLTRLMCGSREFAKAFGSNRKKRKH